MPAFANPVFCALDTADIGRATALARSLGGTVGGLKIGLEAFYAMGAGGYRTVAETGAPVFLDLKLHDIPNTVAGAMRALLPLAPAIVNVHAAGGLAMMRAARETAETAGAARPKVVAVTVLTSLDDEDMSAIGVGRSAHEQAVHLARLAAEAGLDGVVCAPQDVAAVKAACGADFLAVVPGIRPAQIAAGDQKRVTSPRTALEAGADVLVVGRAITGAEDPAAAAAEIVRSLAG